MKVSPEDPWSTDPTVYETVGEDGFERLVGAFYRRIPDDPLLGPMYPADDLEGAEQRLRDFLVDRLGGPPRYLETRGHPRLRRRHMPFPIDVAARDRWLTLMGEALVEAEFPPAVRELLERFFAEVADFLRNRA